MDTSSCSTSEKAKKGHFAVYSANQKRKLFQMAEQEFGLVSNESLTILCEAGLLEYAIVLVKQQHVSRDVKRALWTSIASSCCSSSLNLQHAIN
ncbi:auxin-responsive protein SAUR36-like [Hevea brasiliensis]|uniref:auxin-responsive protein SAUR36-like n=1 Tax=Hevea brasiliensis TaxID=3981 RepID=UPI0025DA96B9|nr:auxin-responsive protein SAUR36-like [Hevea brasiliensis]